MANLTREQEEVNHYHMRHQSNHVSFDDSCKECERIQILQRLPQSDTGNDRAKAYNATHGTQVVNNEALDIILRNEAELRRAE